MKYVLAEKWSSQGRVVWTTFRMKKWQMYEDGSMLAGTANSAAQCVFDLGFSPSTVCQK